MWETMVPKPSILARVWKAFSLLCFTTVTLCVPLTVCTTMTVCSVCRSSCPRHFGNNTRQQLNSLLKSDNIGFGKRLTVHSVLDGQVSIDHDESSQKNVGVKAQVLVALRVRDNAPCDTKQMKKCDDRYITRETNGC